MVNAILEELEEIREHRSKAFFDQLDVTIHNAVVSAFKKA